MYSTGRSKPREGGTGLCQDAGAGTGEVWLVSTSYLDAPAQNILWLGTGCRARSIKMAAACLSRASAYTQSDAYSYMLMRGISLTCTRCLMLRRELQCPSCAPTRPRCCPRCRRRRRRSRPRCRFPRRRATRPRWAAAARCRRRRAPPTAAAPSVRPARPPAGSSRPPATRPPRQLRWQRASLVVVVQRHCHRTPRAAR